ncbi:MAG: hypothetical protein ABR985_20345 [Methanotrichaceae archaeon]|jgi:hypothetical protein
MFGKALNRNLNMQLYTVTCIYGTTPASIARSIHRFEALEQLVRAEISIPFI